jgi:hypothetical protein
MNDDKTAKDYNIEGGSVLHLVRSKQDNNKITRDKITIS